MEKQSKTSGLETSEGELDSVLYLEMMKKSWERASAPSGTLEEAIEYYNLNIVKPKRRINFMSF